MAPNLDIVELLSLFQFFIRINCDFLPIDILGSSFKKNACNIHSKRVKFLPV